MCVVYGLVTFFVNVFPELCHVGMVFLSEGFDFIGYCLRFGTGWSRM
jgi:hypothetical protein